MSCQYSGGRLHSIRKGSIDLKRWQFESFRFVSYASDHRYNLAKPVGKMNDVFGLIPAAGQATRLGHLPCSKEIYPVGFQLQGADGSLFPEVACHCLLQSLRVAGVTRVFIILRNEKWDIPAYLGDGAQLDMHIGYLLMGLPYGCPYTLDQAWPFVQNKRVALGFPDVIFRPANAFVRLLMRQEQTGADVVLGLFPSDRPHKMDMVDVDSTGRVRRIMIKPKRTKLSYSWLLAVWTPMFSNFMHDYLAAGDPHGPRKDGVKPEREKPPELHLGDVFKAWMKRGFPVEAESFSNGCCIDVGTVEDLKRVVSGNVIRLSD